MTLRAIEAGMTASQGKEIVLNVGASPANGDMALLTISRPAIGRVVRAGGTSQIVPMAKIALGRCPSELTGACPAMTAFTGSDGMTGDEGKTCARVLGNKPGRIPVVLVMATTTSQTHGRGMRVRVTTTAPSRHIDCHRTTIIMTT